MTGAWHGGKGCKTRPEAAAGNFSRGYDGIDWNAREREQTGGPTPPKKPLTTKQKLAWQGVGFVIGLVLLALTGGFNQ